MDFMAPPRENLYEILGVPQTASRSEIRAAYYRLAKQSHPDKNPGADPAVFHALQHAYETLSDPQKRAEYDSSSQLSSSPPFPQHFPHPDPMFESLFASMFTDDLADGFFGPSLFGRGRSFQPPWAQTHSTPKWSPPEVKSPATRIDFSCSLEDLVNGRTVASEISRQVGCLACNATGFRSDASHRTCRRCAGSGYQSTTHTTPNGISYTQSTCSSCGGSGSRFSSDNCCSQCRGSCITTETKRMEWKIVKGMLPDQMITLPSLGNSLPGHSPGDIVICLRVSPHPTFKMVSPDSRDLLLHVSITLSEALLGLDRVLFRHLDGRDIRIYLPAPHHPGHTVINPGEIKAIRGMGLPPQTSSEKRGDLWVKFNIEWPSAEWVRNQNYNVLASVLPPSRPDYTSPELAHLPQEYANLETLPVAKQVGDAGGHS